MSNNVPKLACPKCGVESELMHEADTIMSDSTYKCEECHTEFTWWQQAIIEETRKEIKKLQKINQRPLIDLAGLSITVDPCNSDFLKHGFRVRFRRDE